MPVLVRPAAPADLLELEAVELLAAQRFDNETVTASIQKRTVPLAQLRVAQAAELLWVAVTEDRKAVGFLLAEELDGNLHISEMSVVPLFGRQGLGAALLRAAREHALQVGFKGVSLTTFAKVPWNGPFYGKHGFKEMPESEIGAGLAARIKQEKELGLINRLAMHHSGA